MRLAGYEGMTSETLFGSLIQCRSRNRLETLPRLLENLQNRFVITRTWSLAVPSLITEAI
jgi:hypothetical protein